MSELSLSESVENFLKTVLKLQQDHERVSTNALSQALNIKAPSVTDMAQRLQEQDLIHYVKYKGVQLTPKGKVAAMQLLRRHRLIELFLVQELGYAIHEVHDEAENLEHAVSDRFVDALNEKLAFPAYDPHGDPIPTAEGEIITRNLYSLAEVPLNTPIKVSRFTAPDGDMLQYIIACGFKLGITIEVLTRAPFDGPITVQLPQGDVAIGHSVAQAIMSEIIDEK